MAAPTSCSCTAHPATQYIFQSFSSPGKAFQVVGSEKYSPKETVETSHCVEPNKPPPFKRSLGGDSWSESEAGNWDHDACTPSRLRLPGEQKCVTEAYKTRFQQTQHPNFPSSASHQPASSASALFSSTSLRPVQDRLRAHSWKRIANSGFSSACADVFIRVC